MQKRIKVEVIKGQYKGTKGFILHILGEGFYQIIAEGSRFVDRGEKCICGGWQQPFEYKELKIVK